MPAAVAAAAGAVQDFEGKLSAATSRASRAEADLAALTADFESERLQAQQLRGQMDALFHENGALRGQLDLLQQAAAERDGLAASLRQWQESFSRLEEDNKQMREMLGSKAPAPHSAAVAGDPAAAAAGGAVGVGVRGAPGAGGAAPPAVPQVPAAAAGGKAPPPGFGPVPHRQQQQQARGAVQPPQPQPPSPQAAQQHMRNEHELVRMLLSILPEDPHQAAVWGDAQELQVNIALTPLDWGVHYHPIYGTAPRFMQARPAVFGEAGPGRFFKHPGAEEMVRHAEAQQQHEAAAAAAAAAGGMPAGAWPQQQQHMQQQPPPGYGLHPDSGSSGYAPEQQQQLMAAEQQGGWGGHGMASMPLMPPAGALGVPMPGLSVPFLAPHQLGPPMAMSMPMAPPSMPMGQQQQQQQHPAMHHPHPQAMHHGAGGW